MKKSIVFIGIIFLLLLGTTAVLATAEGIIIKAAVENDRIYIGDKTKVGFSVIFSDPEYPEFCITLDNNNFAKNGFAEFNKDCISVKYSSDNSRIAVVDDNGTVTGISAGTVTITQDITLNIQSLSLVPALIVDNSYGGLNSSCQYVSFYSKIFSYNGTYTRKVTMTVVPDDRLYLCQPGKEPTPVKISMNAASLEVDRLSVGKSMNVDYSVTITELNDPTAKYTFNKYDLFWGTALDFENLTTEYSSDNESVATVNKGGLVTGISEGWANITIDLTFNPEILDQEGLNVRIRKARLAVKPSDTAGTVRFTRQISVLVSTSPVMNNLVLAQSKSRQVNIGTGTNKWTVSDPSIAQIDKTGSVTGLRPGRTYIVYYMEEFKKFDGWSGYTRIPVVGSVTVYPVMAIHPDIINVYMGTPTTLKVDFDRFYSGDKAGTWSVADKSIASVDQSGMVTGIRTGKTIVTYTINATGAQTDCTVVVAEPPFRIEPGQLSINNGDTEKFTVTYDSGYTGKKTGTWSAADDTIVSVEDNSTAPIYINKKHTIPGTVGAKVTGLKPGTTRVTFTDTATGARRDCTVTVKPIFKITPDTLTIYEGETGGLSVSFDNVYNGSRDGKWTVDDKTVASIDQNGVVTGIKAGTAIAAYSADPTPSATADLSGIAKVLLSTVITKPAESIFKTVSIIVKPGTFTVTFDPNGGSPTPSKVTVRHDTVVTRPVDPSFSGRRFLGWYTALNGGSVWDFANNKVTEDMTLYAHWDIEWVQSIFPNIQALLISGPDTIELIEGYSDFHQQYIFRGVPSSTATIIPNPLSITNATLSNPVLPTLPDTFPVKILTIPSGLAPGSYFITLCSMNGVFGEVTKTVTVNVRPAESLPTITGPDTINIFAGSGSVDQAYTFGGYPAPTEYGISLTEPNIANASFVGNTLTIPGDGQDIGSYEVTLYASNSAGTTNKTVTVNIFDIGFGSGIEIFLFIYDNRIEAIGGAGDPFTYTIVQGSMPDGLTLQSDGTITGTVDAGNYDPVSVEISDRNGNSITTGMLPVCVYE